MWRRKKKLPKFTLEFGLHVKLAKEELEEKSIKDAVKKLNVHGQSSQNSQSFPIKADATCIHINQSSSRKF